MIARARPVAGREALADAEAVDGTKAGGSIWHLLARLRATFLLRLGLRVPTGWFERCRQPRCDVVQVTALRIRGTRGSGSRMAPERANSRARPDIFFQVLRMIWSHFSSLYSGCFSAKGSM